MGGLPQKAQPSHFLDIKFGFIKKACLETGVYRWFPDRPELISWD